jgi:hypothetical protein
MNEGGGPEKWSTVASQGAAGSEGSEEKIKTGCSQAFRKKKECADMCAYESWKIEKMGKRRENYHDEGRRRSLQLKVEKKNNRGARRNT